MTRNQVISELVRIVHALVRELLADKHPDDTDELKQICYDLLELSIDDKPIIRTEGNKR